MSMGTRVEIHLFGDGAGEAALVAARSAIEAVDDALTIHRPSPATQMNDELREGGAAEIFDPILAEALALCAQARAATLGLFDPAVSARGAAGAWAYDAQTRVLSAETSAAWDFGGFGKGLAADHALGALRAEGVGSALISLGESSIGVLGEHPLGGAWELEAPDPIQVGRVLERLEIVDACLSISSNAGASPAAPSLRPDGAAAPSALTLALAVHPSGAWAEALSTAMLVATEAERAPLRAALKSGRVEAYALGEAAREQHASEE
jgi:thiamine biosynthesis lipoprotein ApbE